MSSFPLSINIGELCSGFTFEVHIWEILCKIVTLRLTWSLNDKCLQVLFLSKGDQHCRSFTYKKGNAYPLLIKTWGFMGQSKEHSEIEWFFPFPQHVFNLAALLIICIFPFMALMFSPKKSKGLQFSKMDINPNRLGGGVNWPPR